MTIFGHVTRRDVITSLAECAQVNDEIAEIESRLWEQRAEFGRRLRSLRQQQGISLRSLAKMCRVSPQMMCDLEHGRRWSTHLPQSALDALR